MLTEYRAELAQTLIPLQEKLEVMPLKEQEYWLNNFIRNFKPIWRSFGFGKTEAERQSNIAALSHTLVGLVASKNEPEALVQAFVREIAEEEAFEAAYVNHDADDAHVWEEVGQTTVSEDEPS